MDNDSDLSGVGAIDGVTNSGASNGNLLGVVNGGNTISCQHCSRCAANGGPEGGGPDIGNPAGVALAGAQQDRPPCRRGGKNAKGAAKRAERKALRSELRDGGPLDDENDSDYEEPNQSRKRKRKSGGTGFGSIGDTPVDPPSAVKLFAANLFEGLGKNSLTDMIDPNCVDWVGALSKWVSDAGEEEDQDADAALDAITLLTNECMDQEGNLVIVELGRMVAAMKLAAEIDQ